MTTLNITQEQYDNAIRAAKAEAWDEGYEEGEEDGNSSSGPSGVNPYTGVRK